MWVGRGGVARPMEIGWLSGEPVFRGVREIDIVMKGHLGITTTTAQGHEIIRIYTVKERI